MTQAGLSTRAATLRRPALRRLLSAVLVFRLELRPPAPLDAGLVLLAWLRRPVIEMPARVAHACEPAVARLRQRLDEVYPF